jgi:hypothetical protein
MKSAALRNALTAWSLANLCFLTAWRAVLYPEFNGYHLKFPPRSINLLALMLDVLLLAVLLWAGAALARKYRGRLLQFARYCFLFAVFFALSSVGRQLYGPLTAAAFVRVLGRGGFVIAVLIALSLLVIVLWRWTPQLVSSARIVILVLLPFAFVTLSLTAVTLLKTNSPTAPAFNNSANAAIQQPRIDNRVVWVIFDELDYHATFAARPASLDLPELDRLRRESFFASTAYPPAGATTLSMPALITGRLVSAAHEISPNELSLTFADENKLVPWSRQPNIFSRVQALGGTTAIVGWHHPYCRVIGNSLTQCWWDVTEAEDHHSPRFCQSMGDYALRSLYTAPLLREVLARQVRRHKRVEVDYVEFLERVRAHAKEIAAESSLSLTLLHLPIPHPDCAYDRLRKEYRYDNRCNYFDSLALVDRTLGELRQVLESAGLWDKTTVLVSTDHWWRINIWRNEGRWTPEEAAVSGNQIDNRIPFLLKLKNQREGMIYDRPFNTIVTHDLILALLGGDLTTPREVATWIDQRPALQKTPY